MSEAYEVLCDDAKRASLQAEEGAPMRSTAQAWTAERAAAEASRRESARALHRTLTWFEVLVHPRILIFLLPAAFLVQYLLNPAPSKPAEAMPTVPAWFNGRTQRWETPQPWDEAFRRMAPEVKPVARHLVHDAASGRR